MQIARPVPNITSAVSAVNPVQQSSQERQLFGLEIVLYVDEKIGITYSIPFEKCVVLPDYDGYPAWQFAKILMGPNFYGHEDFERATRLFLSSEDLEMTSNIPWTKEILESPCPFTKNKMVKETHFLSFVSVRDEAICKHWFEWVLVVKDPSIIDLGNIPLQYGIRRTMEFQSANINKIFARFPEM